VAAKESHELGGGKLVRIQIENQARISAAAVARAGSENMEKTDPNPANFGASFVPSMNRLPLPFRGLLSDRRRKRDDTVK
jgi:hypothetical protein